MRRAGVEGESVIILAIPTKRGLSYVNYYHTPMNVIHM